MYYLYISIHHGNLACICYRVGTKSILIIIIFISMAINVTDITQWYVILQTVYNNINSM